MEGKLLPIGSVCTLKGGEKKLMITAFYVKDESEELFDYCGCFYPEGMINSDEYYVFNQDQIDTVHFIGFINEEEKEFKTELKKFMNGEENSLSDTVVEMPKAVVSDNSTEQKIETIDVLDVNNTSSINSDIFNI